MFSVVFYTAIGFLSLIASTIALNDTLPEKVKLNVTSRVICDYPEVDIVKERTTGIAQLIQSAKVNIVDITVFTRDTKQRYELLLVNHIGRKILPWLEEKSILPLTVKPDGFKSTLNAGRRNFEFYLNDTTCEGCIESELNTIDSFAKCLLSKVAANMKTGQYEVEICYLPLNSSNRWRDTKCNRYDKSVNGEQVNRDISFKDGMKCCKMTGCYHVLKMDYDWVLHSEYFLLQLSIFNVLALLLYVGLVLLRRPQKSSNSNSEQSLYYMLTDNRMSMLYRFGDLFCLQRGRPISVFRALLLVCISLGLFYIMFEIGFYFIIPSLGGLSFIITVTYLGDDDTSKLPLCFKVIAYPLNFIFLCLTIVVAYCLPLLVSFIVMGMVYNILYYLPYVTFSSLFLFYSWHLWKSTMEVRQYTLQMLIHEALEKWGNDTSHVHDPKKENKEFNVLVLYRDLYDKIESKILPYELCLFWFFIKFFILFLVLFFVFHPIFFLFASDFNSDAKVLTAMGVAALTFPLNMIIEKKNEELVKAWRKEMELNVSRMVDWHTQLGNKNLTKTFLSVPHPVSLVDEIHEIYKNKIEQLMSFRLSSPPKGKPVQKTV